MKCLTRIEAQEWLAPLGVGISEDLRVDFGGLAQRNKHVVQRRFLGGDRNLWRVAEAIIGWLTNGSQRMFLFSSWDTYPAGQLNFVEKLRLGCGETRGLIQTPGHLFEAVTAADYDSRSPKDVDEEAIMAGLVLLALLLGWDATIFSKACSDYISISDGFALFSSESAQRVALAPPA